MGEFVGECWFFCLWCSGCCVVGDCGDYIGGEVCVVGGEDFEGFFGGGCVWDCDDLLSENVVGIEFGDELEDVCI